MLASIVNAAVRSGAPLVSPDSLVVDKPPRCELAGLRIGLCVVHDDCWCSGATRLPATQRATLSRVRRRVQAFRGMS